MNVRGSESFILPCLGLFLLVLNIAVYLPGLHGPFVFDDMQNIVNNDLLDVNRLDFQSLKRAAFSSDSGPLSRPVSMLSFVFNRYFFGLNEFSYKLVNVILHFVVALFLFVVARQLISAWAKNRLNDQSVDVGALAASAFWMLHPINLTSVIYVIQRMVELSTLFGLIAIAAYVMGRNSRRIFWGITWHILSVAAALLAVLSKENQVVLILIVALIEVLIFRFESASTEMQPYTRIVKWSFFAAVLLWILLFSARIPSFIDGYAARPFSVSERLLTECRVLIFYIHQIFLPNISEMHLFHDEIRPSVSLISPISTLVSIMFIVSLAFFAWICRKVAPLVALAIGWFFIGHIIESSIVPLELVHAHRNYFPMMGMAVAGGGMVAFLYEKHKRTVLIVSVFLFGALGVATNIRAQDWRSWEVLVTTEAEKNPLSARSQYEAGRYFFWRVEHAGKKNYSHDDYIKAAEYFERATNDDSGTLIGLTAQIRLDDLVGNKPNKALEEMILFRLRDARLSSNDINKLIDVYVCQIKSRCTLETAFFSRVSVAAIESPMLTAFAKAMIAGVASDLALSDGNIEFSLYYAIFALDTLPDNFDFYKRTLLLAKATNNEELIHDLVARFSGRFTRGDQVAEYESILKESSSNN